VTLELDPTQTIVRASGTGGLVLLALPLGWEDLASSFDATVSEGAIERAIERVEDAIGHPRVDIDPILQARGDETLRRMAQAAGLESDADVALTAEAVEALFTRLASQAAGALPIADRLPEDARFAATLVLVRELMHHLRVSTLKIDR
jgi:hypothetical protein